jgi:hypothetical protein
MYLVIIGIYPFVFFGVGFFFVNKASAFFVLTEVKLQALTAFFFQVLCSTSRMYELLMILETLSRISFTLTGSR